MGQTVEQSGGHFGVAEDGGPFAEAEVCGDDDAGALVELAQPFGSARYADKQGFGSKLLIPADGEMITI